MVWADERQRGDYHEHRLRMAELREMLTRLGYSV